MKLNWKANTHAAMLASPSQGDIVHLKLVDTYEYLVKCVVSSTGSTGIEAIVQAVLDSDDRVIVESASVLDLVGQSVLFPLAFVHKVIQPATR